MAQQTIETKDGSWEVERTPEQTRDLFPVGREVRHLNPAMSDWRGKVVVDNRKGRRKGHHIDVPERGPLAWITVRVAWDFGKGVQKLVGWYGAGTIAPVDGEVQG